MSNLFNDLAKTTTTKKSKKNDKPFINIKGDDFDANLKAFAKLKKDADNIKTQMTLVQSFLKSESMEKWFELYTKNGSYPGSTVVTSDSESSFMFAPSDKYLSIDDERAEDLKEKYGDDIVDENVKFSFNPDLLEKYADVLSDLIKNSKDIDDKDKGNLIKAEKSLSVSKGSIEKAISLGDDVETFIKDINPIFSIRSPKIND